MSMCVKVGDRVRRKDGKMFSPHVFTVEIARLAWNSFYYLDEMGEERRFPEQLVYVYERNGIRTHHPEAEDYYHWMDV